MNIMRYWTTYLKHSFILHRAEVANGTGVTPTPVGKKWVSKVCLGVGEKSFNFDPIFESSMRFNNYIVTHFTQGASKEVEFHEKLPIISIDTVTGNIKISKND
ncbi:MAG: hypothetical protein ACYC6O_04365 [Thermoleophilia bacterium]